MDFDRRDGFTYLDNIPFKISSAFLPPSSVVLPSVQNTSSDLSFEKFQYDFSLEKKVLEDIKNKEESVKAAAAAETENMCNKLQNATAVKTGVQSILSLQSNILLPKPKKILDKVTNTDERNNAKINLSDFENDTSSPFDYMELQTINDFEELSNVFQGLNNKYSSDNNMYIDNSAAVNVNENNLAGNISKSQSFPLHSNDSLTLDHNARSTSLVLSIDNCFYPVPDSTDPLEEGLAARTFSYSSLPKVPFFSFPSVKSRVGNRLANDLEARPFLRGSKSVSDIHKLFDSSAEASPRKQRPLTPPSNVCAAVGNNSTSSSVHNTEDSPSDAICDNSSKTNALPDPYNELSEEEQKFVDAIEDMGFSRPQVSRTVKHLGSDEKTVVEHLCQIQTLEESGYDCLEAEAALHLHDYNQEEARKFLDLLNKIQDLGFEKDAVKKALIQNKNDWSKTIDALLS